MAFSVKAQEIHKWILDNNQTDYWAREAEKFTVQKGQYQPGPRYTHDVPGLVNKLKADLGSTIKGATDSNWEEIADWLFELTTPK